MDRISRQLPKIWQDGFRANKPKPAFQNRRFRKIDARGAYKEDDPTAPGGRKFELRNPRNGKVIPLRPGRGWSFDQATFDQMVEENRITFVTDTSVMVRRYLHETNRQTPPSVFYQPARSASERLNRMMEAKVFDYPKDEIILRKFVEMATGDDSTAIVLDFFAGSGTTAHAVMLENVSSGASRRYILVQLPEPLDPNVTRQRSAANYCDEIGKPRHMAELTKERLRRAAKEVKGGNPTFAGDLGFRVFRLDTSNIHGWDPNSDDLDGALLAGRDHIKTGRSELDILYELLLKLGLDLCVPIETRTIAGRLVHSIGSGTLIACLDEAVGVDDVEELAPGIADWHDALAPASESTVVFRDSAFENDVAKTNLTAILEQRGLGNMRSL